MNIVSLFILLTFTAHAKTMDIEYFKSLIKPYEIAHPGKTLNIPDVLDLLPVEYRTYSVLMYRSASAQESSPENPRAIVFGLDAKTIISFNGDSLQRQFNRLELALFNEKELLPEFYTINFPPQDSRDGVVRFSKKNPQECARCHSDVKNNSDIYHYKWREYPYWNGAYGSLNDILELGGTQGTSPVPIVEKENFLKFKAIAKTHPRYQKLPALIGETKTTKPYRQQRAETSGEKIADYYAHIESRPNLHFGLMLARLSAKGVAHALMQARNFLDHRYRLGYLLAGCTGRINPQDELKEIFQKLSVNREDFSLFTRVDNFNPALTRFYGLVYAELFAKIFIKHDKLKEFNFPLHMTAFNMAAKQNNAPYLARSLKDDKIWKAIDDSAIVQSDSFGSEEITAMFTNASLPTLGKDSQSALCEQFSKL